MQFEIPGPPVGKARARVVNGHAYTPERTRQHEETIAGFARYALARDGREMFTGPVIVWARFFLRDHQHEGDIDNYVKAVLDALNGIVYADDKQVVCVHAWKAFDKANPRTVIDVSEPVL